MKKLFLICSLFASALNAANNTHLGTIPEDYELEQEEEYELQNPNSLKNLIDTYVYVLRYTLTSNNEHQKYIIQNMKSLILNFGIEIDSFDGNRLVLRGLGDQKFYFQKNLIDTYRSALKSNNKTEIEVARILFAIKILEQQIEEDQRKQELISEQKSVSTWNKIGKVIGGIAIGLGFFGI